MAKQVKIVTFINDREGREQGEEELNRMVNEGWDIVSSGGGHGADMMWGLVILQREVDDIPETKTD
ncbi:MAG: hypothetical protein AAFR81_15315 [Chloroflexota bacterium]